MNPFIKAALLTIAVVLLSIFVASYFDAARANQLKQNVNSVVFENQGRAVLQHYGQVMAKSPTDYCPYLATMIKRQTDKTYELAGKIQDYERNNLFNSEYYSLKTSYYLQLADIYVSSFENRGKCGSSETPIAFFFVGNTDCPDCRAQSRVFDALGQRCQGVRVYAFPLDTDLEAIRIFSDRHSVSSAPTIVINDKEKMAGLQSEDAIMAKLKEMGVACQ